MTLYSGQVTQLLQGVSQQDPKDRAEGQITAQHNCVSDIVQGLRRRPALKVLAELTDIATSFTLNDKTAVYSYSRGDGSEEYLFLIDTAGNIKIYDTITGAAKTVTNTNQAYLVCSDPAKQLKFHTIGDTTFVLNTTEAPAMDASSATASQNGRSLVYARRASYGHVYRIYINNIQVANCTVTSTVAISTTTQDKQITVSSTDLIKCLADGTTTAQLSSTKDLATDLTAGYSYDMKGDAIEITKDDGTSFSIVVQDGNNNQDLKVIQNSVDAFENLPMYAPEGYKVEVTGLGDERVDNYWVQWISEQANPVYWNGNGYWQECAAPGVETDFDEDTMPTTIVRNSDGTFKNVVPVAGWTSRAAGDDTTNPVPSFIGNLCTDIGSYQNRLYILSEENICMTVAFDQLNFFSKSVAQPSDDDPIDSASSDNQITNLLHSAVYNGALVMFSNNAQFIHPKDEPCTPATFAVAADSKFNVSPNTKPVTTGLYIMFPTEFGDYVNVWEYNINTLTGAPECESSTKHVPRYIKGDPIQMVANTTTDYVFIRTDDDPNVIYVNQFYTKDQKRAQLAWHKWEVPNSDTIYGMTLIGQRLFLICGRNSSVYLEYMDLSLPITDDSDYEVFLDHYYTEQQTDGTYTVDGRQWTARVTLQEAAIDYFVRGSGSANPGLRVTDYVIDSGYVYYKDDADAYLLQGYQYESSGELTNPFVKDSQGKPYTVRTILDDITLYLQDTGWLDFTVIHGAGEDWESSFTGILLNHWQYKIGQASLLDTTVTLPVRDYRELVRIQFSSEHHLGFSVMSFDWHARMNARGRRSR